MSDRNNLLLLNVDEINFASPTWGNITSHKITNKMLLKRKGIYLQVIKGHTIISKKHDMPVLNAY